MLRVRDFVDMLTSEEKDMEIVVKDYAGDLQSLKGDDFVLFNYVDNRVELELFDKAE